MIGIPAAGVLGLLAAAPGASQAEARTRKLHPVKPPEAPIDCAAAEGALRAVAAKRRCVEENKAAGVLDLGPAGALIGIAPGTRKDRMAMLSGGYEEKLDAREAAIRDRCGLPPE